MCMWKIVRGFPHPGGEGTQESWRAPSSRGCTPGVGWKNVRDSLGGGRGGNYGRVDVLPRFAVQEGRVSA